MIVLSHRAALAYYRTPSQSKREILASDPGTILPKAGMLATHAAAARRALHDLGAPLDKDRPLDCMVGRPQKRHTVDDIACHLHPQQVPIDPFASLGDGIYVVGPQLLFLQAALWMTPFELVEFGFELCGGYAYWELAGGRASGFRSRPPLTSTAGLQAFLDRSTGAKGVARAREALRHVRDGSRSIAETAVAMLLCLPRRSGGLGVKGITMNHRVDIAGQARQYTKRSCFYLDIFIPSCMLDIEYDGSEHAAPSRHADDEERTNALLSMGYQVRTLTIRQLMDRPSFLRAMQALRKACGIRGNPTQKELAAQEELRLFVTRHWRQAWHSQE